MAPASSGSGLPRWLTRLVVIFVVIIVALASCAARTPRFEGPASANFDGTRFHNPTPVVKSVTDLLRWQMTREPGQWQFRKAAGNAEAPPQRVDGTTIRSTFVNHATVLIQTGGVNILTDPIWSERASPLAWAGPKRFTGAGIAFADLPPIDAVLVSHNHFDHMDLPTLARLASAHAPVFVVPLGNAAYLRQAGIDKIVELDWWQHLSVGEVTVHAVPAKHWSRRGLFDTNRALWAGYYLTQPEASVFFAGDTGMGEHFAEIRQRLGAPDLALLPIGAYLPRWFMEPQHIDPAEAVQAHDQLGARYGMAIHFGTFALGDDGQDQGVADLQRALAAASAETTEFWIPLEGESRVFSRDREWASLQTAERRGIDRSFTTESGSHCLHPLCADAGRKGQAMR